MKHLVAGLGLGLGVAVAALPVAAQDYPARDIHAICVFPAGSGGDVFVRYFSSKLSEALGGKTVVVENKPGALGNIGSEFVAKAKPDGYTILITPGSSTLAASPHTFKKIAFDPVKDFTPVTTLSKLAFAMVVDPKTPIRTVADLTAHLKKKGDKASYAAATNTGNVATELYKSISGAPALPIPYKDYTVPLPDLIAGNLDFFIADPVFVVEHSKAGRVRPLAVTSANRMSALPDVPTMEEAGVKGFGELIAWWSVFVPAGTPAPIVKKLEDIFNKIVLTEETKKFLGNSGADPFPGSAESLKALLARDLQKWGEYVKLAKIEPQ